jgi:hypothetical protein
LTRSAFRSGPFRAEQALRMWNQHPSVLRLHKRISPMATSASQTYISKLGFQDRDRSNERHGLACEYLFERIIELEVAPWRLKSEQDAVQSEINFNKRAAKGETVGYYMSEKERFDAGQEIPQLCANFEKLNLAATLANIYQSKKVGECVNVPIKSRSYVNGFADVLIDFPNPLSYCGHVLRWLGEVKITKEPAENILQQINFYLSYLENVETVYILTDYDPGDLKRLCAGTKIKVYRLGQVFEQWLANRTNPETEEL